MEAIISWFKNKSAAANNEKPPETKDKSSKRSSKSPEHPVKKEKRNLTVKKEELANKCFLTVNKEDENLKSKDKLPETKAPVEMRKEVKLVAIMHETVEVKRTLLCTAFI